RVKYPSLEKALSIWVNQVIVSGLSVSEALISEKAHYFARLWANDVPLELLPNMQVKLRTLIAKYRPKDVFNADETGLFFRIEPNQILSSGPVTEKKK
ncbi:1148_t:CDS:2, partial [Dentiscutata heterogama]